MLSLCIRPLLLYLFLCHLISLRSMFLFSFFIFLDIFSFTDGRLFPPTILYLRLVRSVEIFRYCCSHVIRMDPGYQLLVGAGT